MTGDVLDPGERRDWLRLTRADGVGAATFAYLIQRYGSPKAALAALPDLARRGGRATQLRVPSEIEAQNELDAGARLGARLLISADEDFPALLGATDPPPPLIWVRGDPTLLGKPCVAIVGARAASASGQRFSRDLAQALSEAGWVVVSGLARG